MEHDGLGVSPQTDSVALNVPDLAALEAEKRALEVRLDEAREALTCRVCLDRPVAAVFMPCAHLNTCSTCSASLTTCPLCRSPIHYAAPVIID
ncbi:baculoviral IAP repeat-containing protein 7-like [Homarus americanus]|uniref:baculoviral IAP repeat-containing protein 7-like n=1 Tax=Homarus americanus TaxID=6706 RepID=UPI001C44E13A|nr:baculoviral IAP repeat-containing protein 7-like [Homarus americanus]